MMRSNDARGLTPSASSGTPPLAMGSSEAGERSATQAVLGSTNGTATQIGSAPPAQHPSESPSIAPANAPAGSQEQQQLQWQDVPITSATSTDTTNTSTPARVTVGAASSRREAPSWDSLHVCGLELSASSLTSWWVDWAGGRRG